MRVTIDIPNEIHAKLKTLAKAERTTMRAIILQAIDALLQAPKTHAPIRRIGKLKLPLVRSKRPGTLKLGKQGVYEYIDFP